MSGSLYLGAQHFDGDPGELLPGYHRLLERFGIDNLDVHLCIVRDDGLTVFDACPSKAVYEEFTTSDMFREAVAAAGCPRRASRVSAISRSPICVRRFVTTGPAVASRHGSRFLSQTRRPTAKTTAAGLRMSTVSSG